MNCLKSLRKNFQWLQEPLHVYLHRFMRKLMETLTLHTRMQFILPPTEGTKNSNGKGVQEKAISKGVGSDSQVLFFQGLWNKNYCFYWWFYINSYSSECFFHSLPVWYSLHVYECHRFMNYAGHPAHCFIFHNIIVVSSVLWSCPISLLLTCF